MKNVGKMSDELGKLCERSKEEMKSSESMIPWLNNEWHNHTIKENYFHKISS